MFQNRVFESAYNEFTNRLSNWISDRLEPASLLDYGKVNLMQNRYELRMFLETNHKRYLKAMEDMKIQQAAENRKEDETESDDQSGSDLTSSESDEPEDDAAKGSGIKGEEDRKKRRKDKKSAVAVNEKEPKAGFGNLLAWKLPTKAMHSDYDKYTANIDDMPDAANVTTEIVDVG
jgi:hypothetical protein